jgi:hypothetical protein
LGCDLNIPITNRKSTNIWHIWQFIAQFIAQDVVDLLKRVQIVVYNNVVMPKCKNVVFHRLRFVIPKDLAA